MTDYNGNELDKAIGRTVELHPACDLWMRGARYGVLVGFNRKGLCMVRMDHPQVRRLQRLTPDLIRLVFPIRSDKSRQGVAT